MSEATTAAACQTGLSPTPPRTGPGDSKPSSSARSSRGDSAGSAGGRRLSVDELRELSPLRIIIGELPGLTMPERSRKDCALLLNSNPLAFRALVATASAPA